MPDKDVHVKITFEIERYDAHYYINDDNGKTSINLIGITGKNSYEFGEEVNLTVENPDTDSKYRYEGLYVYCDNKLIASTKDSKIKFNMPSGNIDVYARFHKRGVQTLGFYVNEGYGKMEFEGYRFTEDNRLTQVREDSVIKCKVIPDEGYRLKKAEIKYSTVLQETKTELEFSFIMPNEQAIVSLYFEKIPTYTVKFNKNGGDGTMAPIENVKEGTVIKVPECEFTRGDYNFVGWIINNEEVKTNEITVNSDIELYAKWNLPSYTITISCNEGGTIILGAWELSKNVYEAYKGDDVMMEVSPEKGYRVVPGSLRFEPEYVDEGNDLGFKMPASNVTIYCEFEINCKHTYTTKIPGKPATCTEDGYTDGLKCAGCGKVLEEQTKIPKLDHKWDDGEVTIPNDYDHPGIKTFHCLNEGCTETKTQFIPKLVCMHVITKIVPAQPATCTEDGYSDIVCDICKKVFNKVTIPATGHKWDEGKVTKDPTNDENGEKLYTCTNDGCMETKTEIIPMLVCEHTNTEVIPGKAPTCIEEGLTDGLKCARCEKVLEEQTTIAKLDHKWDEGKVIKPATTTEKGIKEYKCTNDGCTETKTEDIPKLGGGSSGGGSSSGSGSGGSGSGSTLKDDKLPQAINKDITLYLDSNKMIILGEEIENDVMPIVRNNRTMLPIRVIAETLGAKVEWNEKEPTIVKITKGDKVIIITLGSNIAKVNDKEYELEQEAFAENNRTYMPVRFIAENLDAVVEWNEKNPSEVKIYEK